MSIDRIIDANVNRAAEGLRVIEEYTRFVAGKKLFTDQLALLRKRCHQLIPQDAKQLNGRDTNNDMRAKEVPPKRKDIQDVLVANFKRVQESCRVLEEYTGQAGFNEVRYDCYQLEKEIVLRLCKKQIKLPGVYLISAEPDVLKKGIEWGVSLIQLRDKDASKSEIYNKAKIVKSFLKDSDIPFICNDYLDIVQALDLDGLHTGQDDMPIEEQRQLLGPHKIIGRTTSTLTLGKEAEAAGADYVSVGPLWETPSKPGRAAIGFDYLAEANQLSIPYVAIGGINKSNVDEVIAYKPPLIAVIRSFEDVPYYMKTLMSFKEV